MNEIEKMYRNAGVVLIEETENGACCKNPFTAEKQLELIKWLARKGLLQINYSSHQCYQFNSFRIGGNYKADISEALASHYNNLWQDLTEEERKQIKNILESEVRE